MPFAPCRRRFLAGLLGVPGLTRAQDFPRRTVRILVGLTPGSAGDSVARFLAAQLPAILGQPVVVENRPGAHGIIAVRAVLSAPADGHTLFLATNSPMSVNPVLLTDLPYRPEHDLVPVSGLFRTANLFVAPAATRFTTLAEVMREGRRSGRPLDIATYSQGYWLVAAWFAHTAGITFTNVPYKGMAPALADLAGNHVGLGLVDQSGAGSLIAEGRLRALAITSEVRHPRFPAVPTVKEIGYPGFSHYSWGAVYAAAGTPHTAVSRLTAAVHAVLKGDAGRAFLSQQGLEPHAVGPSAMRAFHLDQLQRYRRIAVEAGIQPQ